MDIADIPTVSEDAGKFVHFKDLAGKLLYDGSGETKTPVGARISGTYSSFFREALRRLQKEASDAIEAETLDEAQKNAAADAYNRALEAACIREWTFTSQGQPFAITTENWAALVARQPQWRLQVLEQMNNHASFSAAA